MSPRGGSGNALDTGTPEARLPAGQISDLRGGGTAKQGGYHGAVTVVSWWGQTETALVLLVSVWHRQEATGSQDVKPLAVGGLCSRAALAREG